MQEAQFLLGVRGEVEEIGVELKRMKVFLRNADAKRDEDETLANRVAEIRELADEVEDVLETFAIEVVSRKSSGGGLKNDLKRYVCIFNECIAIHKVGSEIININNKLTKLTTSLARYDIPKGEISDSTHENERLDRLTFPHAEEEFVAMEEDIAKLVSHLVSEKHFAQVVSIWGMGGLGKTSLAREVYNHREVRQCFDCFAWVCVTQQCQPRKLLQDILCELDSQNNTMTDQQLVKKLYEVQIEKKCLVVIDDIWSIDDLERLKHAFPSGEKNTGSKVLLTTRQKDVALHADPSGLHEPKGLGEEDSWNLLQKKAFPRREIGTGFTIDPKMEDLGKQMVRQCGGLPLAVVVLEGILAMKQTSREWELVLQNIKGYLAKGGKGVAHVLALSYNYLPYHLKPCFLYLANFPEDSDIEATRLYHLWVAERLVLSDDRKEGETMMDVAEHYLGELAQRSMVQVCVKEAQKTTRRFKSCRLHDLMRDLCLSKVKEENFLKVVGSGAGNKECSTSGSLKMKKTRRLVVHNDDDDEEEVGYEMYLEKRRARYLRSLLLFRGGRESWVKVKANINNFKLLRVFDIYRVNQMNEEELPTEIGGIMQLRYLSLKYSWIKNLPSSIEKLGYLETLDLRVGDLVLFIPNVLWKLQQLRHLYLPLRIHFDSEKKEKKLRLDGLNNLETLVNFNSEYFDVEDLFKLNNLRKLKAYVKRELKNLAHLSTAITSTNSLLQKSSIYLEGSCFPCPKPEEVQVNLRKILGCHHLSVVFLRGSIGNGSLENYNLSASITKLDLFDCELTDDPMPTLGKLPFLTRLELGGVYAGIEMVCCAIDFPNLTYLILSYEKILENWRVDEGAFPKLTHCTICDCNRLKMIPDGFKFITSLQELRIVSMGDGFQTRLGIDGEDYHKVKHIPSIKYTQFW